MFWALILRVSCLDYRLYTVLSVRYCSSWHLAMVMLNRPFKRCRVEISIFHTGFLCTTILWATIYKSTLCTVVYAPRHQLSSLYTLVTLNLTLPSCTPPFPPGYLRRLEDTQTHSNTQAPVLRFLFRAFVPVHNLPHTQFSQAGSLEMVTRYSSPGLPCPSLLLPLPKSCLGRASPLP